VDIKKNATGPRVNASVISLATWGVDGTTDNKLQQWLNSVSPPNVSKITDQNGKPRPVFHGTHVAVE
jgi:hypothetical protein